MSGSGCFSDSRPGCRESGFHGYGQCSSRTWHEPGQNRRLLDENLRGEEDPFSRKSAPCESSYNVGRELGDRLRGEKHRFDGGGLPHAVFRGAECHRWRTDADGLSPGGFPRASDASSVSEAAVKSGSVCKALQPGLDLSQSCIPEGPGLHRVKDPATRKDRYEAEGNGGAGRQGSKGQTPAQASQGGAKKGGKDADNVAPAGADSQ